jgi:hypothetical protein
MPRTPNIGDGFEAALEGGANFAGVFDFLAVAVKGACD